MYNIVDYSKSINLLANSILYKLEGIAITNNAYIKKYYPQIGILDDKATWKYYVNLTGNYHQLDDYLYPDGLLVKLIETGEEVKLTVDVLKTYRQTRKELLMKGELYKKLIVNYPNCNLLLRGLLHPTDIETLLEVKDGTILGYNSELVERNEVSLIFKLGLAIKNLIERWYNKKLPAYEELYVANLMKTITSMLILKIHNIRLDLIGTREVHSFHMGQFFNSNLDIGKYLEDVPCEQKMWLYKELKYITTNIGQDKSFNSLVEHLLHPAGIDVIEYSLDVNNPKVKEDISDITKPLYEIEEDNVYAKSSIDTKRLSIDELTFKCFETISEYQELFNVTELTTFNKLKNDTSTIEVKEDTKIISLSPSTTSFTNHLDNVELLLDNWLYATFILDIEIENYYLNTDTGKSYSLTSKTAILIVLKMILTMNNQVGETFTRLKLNSVFKNTQSDVLLNIPESFDSSDIITEMPNIDMLNNTVASIKDYMVRLKDWIFRCNVVKSKNTNGIESSLLDIVMERLSEEKIITFGVNYKTIDDYLEDLDIIYPTEIGIDYTEPITDIVKLFTGTSLDNNRDNLIKLLNYKGIIDSLTSYTLLVTVDKNKNTIPVPYTTTGINAGLDAFNIHSGTSKCLEHPYASLVEAVADNDNDKLLVISDDITNIARDDSGNLDITVETSFDELTITNNVEIEKE